jgi:hypothetical protein
MARRRREPLLRRRLDELIDFYNVHRPFEIGRRIEVAVTAHRLHQVLGYPVPAGKELPTELRYRDRTLVAIGGAPRRPPHYDPASDDEPVDLKI